VPGSRCFTATPLESLSEIRSSGSRSSAPPRLRRLLRADRRGRPRSRDRHHLHQPRGGGRPRGDAPERAPDTGDGARLCARPRRLRARNQSQSRRAPRGDPRAVALVHQRGYGRQVARAASSSEIFSPHVTAQSCRVGARESHRSGASCPISPGNRTLSSLCPTSRYHAGFASSLAVARMGNTCAVRQSVVP